MPSAFDRLSLHASKLQVLASASLLRGVFDEFERKEKAERAGRGTAHILGDNLTGKLSLAKFAFALKAFDVPGCPVLSKSDVRDFSFFCFLSLSLSLSLTHTRKPLADGVALQEM